MKKLILLFLLALLPLSLSAQTEDWDRALDQYESITIKCIRLKQELSGGGSVSSVELRRLAGELNGLKTSLHGASGRMTAAQRARLSEIRKMYAEGVPRSTAGVQLKSMKAPVYLFADPPAGDIKYHSDIIAAVKPVREFKPSGRPFAIVSAGLIPDLSFGVMAGKAWQCWGLYASARSNYVSSRHSFDCLSDGRIYDGSIIWTSGKSKVSRLNLSAGALWCPTVWGSVYMGCGYGRRLLLWQDSGGEWAEVSNRSSAGVMLDAGILLHYDNLVFSFGTSVVPGTSDYLYADLSVGIGWKF